MSFSTSCVFVFRHTTLKTTLPQLEHVAFFVCAFSGSFLSTAQSCFRCSFLALKKCIALVGAALGSPDLLPASVNSRKVEPRKETRDPTCPPPATALVLLRFCLGWCQISYHACTMRPGQPSSAPKQCRLPSRSVSAELTKSPSLRRAGSVRELTTREAVSASETPSSPLLQPSCPQAAARPAFAAGCGPISTVPWTPTCPLPRRSSAATSEKMQSGDQMARHALRVIRRICATHTLWTL